MVTRQPKGSLVGPRGAERYEMSVLQAYEHANHSIGYANRSTIYAKRRGLYASRRAGHATTGWRTRSPDGDCAFPLSWAT